MLSGCGQDQSCGFDCWFCSVWLSNIVEVQSLLALEVMLTAPTLGSSGSMSPCCCQVACSMLPINLFGLYKQKLNLPCSILHSLDTPRYHGGNLPCCVGTTPSPPPFIFWILYGNSRVPRWYAKCSWRLCSVSSYPAGLISLLATGPHSHLRNNHSDLVLIITVLPMAQAFDWLALHINPPIYNNLYIAMCPVA